MTDISVLQTRLTEAEKALHALMTGKQVVTIGNEGDTVTYNQAGAAALRIYIRELKSGMGLPSRPSATRINF
ncbi:MAG: gpW family head-tail joining protein [Sneathiella sp.]